jgi:hypothetical protein
MSVVANLVATPETYLEVSASRYARVLGALPAAVQFEAPRTQLRFHHLRYHADSRPMVRELAEELTNHLIQFCLSERRFTRPHTNHDLSKLQALQRDARQLLRRAQTGGEAGEMLLYFLMEAVLKAPQVVCKMELKNNPKVEVLGSDGIHLRWDAQARVYDVFFGEAKLEQTAAAAIRNASKSISKFHKSGRRETEIRLVTAQFKYLDPAGQEIAAQLAHTEDFGAGLRTNHACLVGFDAASYAAAVGSDFREVEIDFLRAYAEKVADFRKLIEKHFRHLAWTRARFEIFLLPFPDVDSFRTEFDRAIGGIGEIK